MTALNYSIVIKSILAFNGSFVVPSDSVSLAPVTADRSCACITSISLLMHAERLFQACSIDISNHGGVCSDDQGNHCLLKNIVIINSVKVLK